MSTQKYVVLRAKSMDPNEILEAGPAVRGGGVSEDLEVNVSDLSRNDLVEVHRDTQTIGTAPSMPMILIEPLEGSEESIGQNGTTWGVGAVGATDSNFTGAGVDVAVLDTGIDAAHQAFNGVDIVEKDFTGEGNGDVNGHGTHCAGAIFGRDVDGLRIGVATGVSRAFVGKVIGENSGSTDSIFEGILWALNEGANVVSMSLGIDFPGFVKRLQDFGFPPELATSKALEGYRANVRLSDKLAGLVRARDAFSRGMLLVAAAGNESRRNVNPDFEITVSPPRGSGWVYFRRSVVQNGR